MVRVKGFKTIIYILLIILLAGCFFSIFITFSEKELKPNAIGEEWYQFSTANALSLDEYLYYDYYEIINKEGYIGFCRTFQAEFVEEYVMISNFFVGCNIYLMTDITLTEEDYNNWHIEENRYGASYLTFGPFYGTFYGNGHFIKYEFTHVRKVGSDDTYTSVFCGSNAGTIKNLRLINPSIKLTGSLSTKTSFAGMIAATNSGTIENCIVESPKFESGRAKDYCSVAPIAAKNSGEVENCLVMGTYEINTSTNSDGLRASHFVAEVDEASSCVFVGTVKKGGKTTKNTEGPEEYDTNAVDLGNYVDSESAYSSSSLSTYYWYKYKSGYLGESSLPIFLKSFIDFTYYKFNVSPEDGGSVNINELTVPTAYNTITYATTNFTNDTICVYGESVLATPNDQNEFERWSVDSTSHTFTATFKTSLVDIYFSHSSNSVLYYFSYEQSKYVKVSGGYHMSTLVANSVIEIITEEYSKSGCFSTYTFKFTNKDGDVELVKYEVRNKYYITGNTMNASNSSVTITADTPNRANIQVTTELKEYNVSFG